MGDIARCSLGGAGDYYNEELLYKLFGVNAELLIDHAWGWEPCTIADVKAYKPENKSIVSGQVLQCPYSFDKARLVVREMADALALDLVDKGLVTNQLVLTVGYDIENLVSAQGTAAYTGAVTMDRYGRKIPKHAVGTENFPYTSSANDLLEAVASLYDRIADKALLVRRLSISANRLLREDEVPRQDEAEQMRKVFEQRRDLIVRRINAMPGVSCLKPSGAFYVMMNLEQIIGKQIDGQVIGSGDVFAKLLLEKSLVAVVPGSGFGAPNFVRLSYAISTENIETGMDRLEAFLKQLQ